MQAPLPPQLATLQALRNHQERNEKTHAMRVLMFFLRVGSSSWSFLHVMVHHKVPMFSTTVIFCDMLQAVAWSMSQEKTVAEKIRQPKRYLQAQWLMYWSISTATWHQFEKRFQNCLIRNMPVAPPPNEDFKQDARFKEASNFREAASSPNRCQGGSPN